MKKFLLLAVLALALAAIAHAGWWRTYGGSGFDEGRCVQVASDGNYVIAGHTDGSLWLLKTDTSGNILFSQTYEGGSTWCEETSDGRFIISGTPDLMKTDSSGDSLWAWDYGINSLCVQETPDGGYIVLGDEGGLYPDHFILIKTDSQGDSLWQQSFAKSGNNWNKGYFLQVTDDDGYVVTGLTGYIDFDTWNVWSTGWLVKTDSDGNVEWDKTYGEEEIWNSPMRGNCVRQTGDGGYIITGLTVGGLWMIRTDASGDSLWAHRYSSSDGGLGINIQETSDSGYVITGITTSSFFSTTPQLNSLWLVKTDSLGDTIWSRIYGGEDSDGGRCVSQTNDDGYIITGYTQSFGVGSSDVYLLKTDSLGLLCVEEGFLPETKTGLELITSIGCEIVFRYFQGNIESVITIYDALGRKVDILHVSNASNIINWGRGFTPGVYFIKALDNTNQEKSVKVVLTD